MECADTYDVSTAEYMPNVATKDWRKWLALGHSLELENRRIFMWIWPTENELLKFGSLLKAYKIEHILSVGCGNGLLEWIIQESLGISVNGIEVDRKWWESKYAIKNFIDLNYIDELKDQNFNQADYLQKCCNLQNWNFALMFCYFNNRDAFNNYLQLYKGDCLIIIGPHAEMDVFTDPMPLEPQFPEQQKWALKTTLSIGKIDIIAFYSRVR